MRHLAPPVPLHVHREIDLALHLDLLRAPPLGRIHPQQMLHDGANARLFVQAAQIHLCVHHLLLELLVVRHRERVFAGSHLLEGDPQRPHVRLDAGIPALAEQLWRPLDENSRNGFFGHGATHQLVRHPKRIQLRLAELAQNDFIVGIQLHAGGLDSAVDYVVGMEGVQRFAHIYDLLEHHFTRRLDLGQNYVLEQVASRPLLHQQD